MRLFAGQNGRDGSARAYALAHHDKHLTTHSPPSGQSRWKLTANAPTTRYSTSFEFNNASNSRKSLLSGIRMASVVQVDGDLQALLRRQGGVRKGVGLFRFLEAPVHLNLLLHSFIIGGQELRC